MAAIQLYLDNRLPSLADTFTVGEDETPFVFPIGATVKFSMRPVDSAILTLDEVAAVIVDANAGTVRYDWAVGDLDTAGEYVAWWTVEVSGQKQDSNDFSISVGTHAPLVDTTATFTWPTREYMEAVSDFDFSEVHQERFQAWSRGAIADIRMETGRDSAYFAGLAGTSVEAEYAREVFQLLVEQRSVKRREDVMESEYDDTYSSFTAGAYSESKPSLKDRNPVFARMVNSSPEIARKLWHLMTEEKKDELRALAGEVVPKEYVLETDWFDDPYSAMDRGSLLWWNY